MEQNEKMIDNTSENIAKLISDAESGDSDAQYQIGIMYYKGIGIAQDYEAAIKWYKIAAEQKHPEALRMLGCAYLNGNGVEKDTNQALYYFLEAQKYYTDSVDLCALMENTYLALDKLKRLSYEKFEMATEYAQDGKGCISCSKKEYDQKKRGCPFFQKELAELYRDKYEYEKAFVWYEKAALQGRSDAQYQLGVLYRDGRGVEKNMAKSMTLFRKGALQGDVDSIKELFRKIALQRDLVTDKESLTIDDDGVAYTADGQILLLCKNENLVHYSIKNDCEKISKGAFAGCKSLETIHLNEGLTEIGAYSFAGCSKLQPVKIPSSVEKIGFGAFYAVPKIHVVGYAINRDKLKYSLLEIKKDWDEYPSDYIVIDIEKGEAYGRDYEYEHKNDQWRDITDEWIVDVKDSKPEYIFDTLILEQIDDFVETIDTIISVRARANSAYNKLSSYAEDIVELYEYRHQHYGQIGWKIKEGKVFKRSFANENDFEEKGVEADSSEGIYTLDVEAFIEEILGYDDENFGEERREGYKINYNKIRYFVYQAIASYYDIPYEGLLYPDEFLEVCY